MQNQVIMNDEIIVTQFLQLFKNLIMNIFIFILHVLLVLHTHASVLLHAALHVDARPNVQHLSPVFILRNFMHY